MTGPPADSEHALDPQYQHTVRAGALFGDFTYEGLLNFYQSENVVVNRDANRTDRLLVVGTIDPQSGGATLQPLFVLPNTGELKTRVPGAYAIVLRNAAGTELARYPFTPALGATIGLDNENSAGSIAWSAAPPTPAKPWLALSKTSGKTNDSVRLTCNPAGMSAGDGADVSFTGAGQTEMVHVELTIPCTGDRNENGQTTVDEVLTMVNIALGNEPISDCLAGDANDDGQITSMRSSGPKTTR